MGLGTYTEPPSLEELEVPESPVEIPTQKEDAE